MTLNVNQLRMEPDNHCLTPQSRDQIQLDIQPGISGKSCCVVIQDGGQSGEEFIHQNHIVLEPQDQVSAVSHHLLQFVVTEDEVCHNLLFFGPVGWTGTSERGCSE